MKKRGKKAQFYLIAAIIIIMILITILSVRTYIVTKPEPRKLQDLRRYFEPNRLITNNHKVFGVKNV